MLSIVKYAEAHVPSLAAAFNEIFDESEIPYFEDYEDSGHSFVGLDRNNQVGAFILIGKTDEAICPYEMKFIGVLPRHRNKGISLALINRVLSVLKEPLWLNVLETNVRAARFYEHMNFKVARRFTTQSGDHGVCYVINLNCFHCGVELTTDTMFMDEVFTGYVITLHGPKQVMKPIRACKDCVTKVES